MSNTWFRLRRGFFLSFFPSDTPHYENVPFEVPSSWVWTNIEELFFVTKLAGFEYTDCLTKDTISSNNEVPIVRAQNVRMGYFVENTNEAISEALSQQLERSALTKKCLLMTFIGAGIGDTCIFPALKRCHLAPNVAKIEPYSNKIDLKYALYYLMSDLGQLGVRGISKSTAQPSLSMATIRSLEIALPPLAEQHRIVAEIEKLFELIDQIEQGKADLQTIIKQTKSKILDLAIHGKLVPQDPNDEPASVLLERIRAEKEELIKQGKIKRDKKESVIFKGDDNSYYEKIDGEVSCIDEEIPYNIPDTWTWVRLENCCVKEIRRGKSPKYAEISNVIVFAQKCNTKYNGIDISLAQYLDETTIKRYPTDEHMQDGDIVINSTGTGTLGRVGIYRNTDNTTGLLIVPDSHVTVIRSFSCISSYYLYAFMKAHQTELEKKGEGSTNQKELKPLTLKEMLIAVPPISEQKRINKSINVAFSHLAIIEKCLN